MYLLFISFAFSFTNTNHFDLGLSYERFEYEEPGVMTEEGELSGVELQYEYYFAPKTSIKLNGSYFAGNLHYDGSILGTGTPVETDTEDWVYYLGARLQHYSSSNRHRLSIGIETRTWFNDLVISYTRETQYYYVPFGWDFQLTSTWHFGIQYNYWLEGKNTSTISDVDPSRNDVHFTQDEGRGYKLHFTYLTQNQKIYWVLFYEYWEVENSDVQSDGTQLLIEPHNNITTYGLSLFLQI